MMSVRERTPPTDTMTAATHQREKTALRRRQEKIRAALMTTYGTTSHAAKKRNALALVGWSAPTRSTVVHAASAIGTRTAMFSVAFTASGFIGALSQPIKARDRTEGAGNRTVRGTRRGLADLARSPVWCSHEPQAWARPNGKLPAGEGP